MMILIMISFLCTAIVASFRVIGGQDALPGQFPWQVAVVITTGNTQLLCGGSIIHSKYVLTAGHCVRNLHGGGDKVSLRQLWSESLTIAESV